MLNKIMLIGRLVADPEVRFTPSGKQVASFRIAVDRNYKQNEEWKRETLFVRIVAWTYLAKKVGEYFRKGMLVFVEGRLQIQASEKNGQKTWFTDVIADNTFMLERKNTNQSEGGDFAPQDSSSKMGSPDALENQSFEDYDFVPEELEEIA
ncbi:MAG TPA: single-stranded DNA-binding protein [Caldisericia bacterium]|nr:single-stranded DNA-binding protein [Caldisericia bacterium]